MSTPEPISAASSEKLERIPTMQRILDNPFLLLFLGVTIPTVLYIIWGVMEIAVNPYDSTGFKNGDVLLRVMQTADVGVRHGASFAVMSDALTPGF